MTLATYQKKIIFFVTITILFTTMAWRMIDSTRGNSATSDEAIHILSGTLIWDQGDYRLNPEHPMLGKLIAAVPHALLHTPLPTLTQFSAVAPHFYYDTWQETRATANAWLYQSGLNPQQILWPSRLINIILTLGLGLAITTWALHRWGSIAAVTTAVLYSLDPILIAHGQLANTDLWATTGYVMTVLTFLRYLEAPSRSRLWISAIAFGVALNLKYSLVVLVPFIVCAWLVARIRFKRALTSYLEALGVFIAGWLVVTCLTYVGALHFVPAFDGVTQLPGGVAHQAEVVLRWLFPAEYWKGFLMVLGNATIGRPTYFWDQFGRGWWQYFPIAYALKESTLMVVLTIGLLTSVVQIRRWTLTAWVLGLAIALFWMAAINSQLTIGVRHLLPVIPIIILSLAWYFSVWWTKALTWSRLVTGVLAGAVVAATSLSLSQAHPFYLSYFNELSGGPEKGSFIVAESNIDWGQDLVRLADWLKTQHVTEPVLLQYFGTGLAGPSYYGIPYEPLTAANLTAARLIVISQSELVTNPEFAGLRSQTPTAMITPSIAVFDHRLPAAIQ